MENTITPQDVRDRALAARVTLSKVFEEAKIPASTFWRWEGGHQTPRPLTIARISDALCALENGKSL